MRSSTWRCLTPSLCLSLFSLIHPLSLSPFSLSLYTPLFLPVLFSITHTFFPYFFCIQFCPSLATFLNSIYPPSAVFHCFCSMLWSHFYASERLLAQWKRRADNNEQTCWIALCTLPVVTVGCWHWGRWYEEPDLALPQHFPLLW